MINTLSRALFFASPVVGTSNVNKYDNRVHGKVAVADLLIVDRPLGVREISQVFRKRC